MAAPQLTRTGSQLRAGGAPVRLAGANYYDAVLTDAASTPGQLSLTTRAMVDQTLDQLAATGHNLIRVHTLFISYGKAGTARPSLSAWNETVLAQADYLLAQAAARNLRVMAPLVDSWDFYHGGAITFSRMVSGAATLDDFCTNGTVIAQFKAYVSTLMNRVNTITGVAWKDDPTLAVIETANEAWQNPFVTTSNSGTGGQAWHAHVAAWLKDTWPNKLVADGFACSGSGAVIPAHSLGNQNFDIVGTHLYDDMRNNTTFVATQAARAVNAGQVFFVGEYDWRNTNAAPQGGPAVQNTGTTRKQFLDAIAANPNVAGAAWWAPRVAAQGTNNGGYELVLDSPKTSDQTAARTELASFNDTIAPAGTTRVRVSHLTVAAVLGLRARVSNLRVTTVAPAAVGNRLRVSNLRVAGADAPTQVNRIRVSNLRATAKQQGWGQYLWVNGELIRVRAMLWLQGLLIPITELSSVVLPPEPPTPTDLETDVETDTE